MAQVSYLKWLTLFFGIVPGAVLLLFDIILLLMSLAFLFSHHDVVTKLFFLPLLVLAVLGVFGFLGLVRSYKAIYDGKTSLMLSAVLLSILILVLLAASDTTLSYRSITLFSFAPILSPAVIALVHLKKSISHHIS